MPTTTQSDRERLLSFCIVGGGPTGIEFAAELHDLITDNLKKLYPNLFQYVNVHIYDVADQILGAFDKKLGEYASKKFARSGITLHLRTSPIRVERDRLIFKNGTEPKTYGMLVWSTGLMASPLIKSLRNCKKHEKTKGLKINELLQVITEEDTAMEDVYAMGDCASSLEVLPATAQVASQQGKYLARTLNRSAMGVEPKLFEFKNRGIMAFLGSGAAIVQGKGTAGISGRTAYFIWKFAYLTMTVSMRNRILIPIYWALNGLLGRDINRF